ncbi:MAG: hypothetical protein AAGL96_04240 [Pseudomonadota bacterium]
MFTGVAYRALAALIALLLLAQTAVARDMTLVIQRLDDSTEIYVSADAPTLFTAFAADTDVVPSNGAFVDFDAFFEGTWGVGDALLTSTDVTIAGKDAGFEAMSFMLHPATEKLPLRTRIDGMIAMSVCNTIEPGARYLLNDLQAYVGYFSDHGSADAAIEFRLPTTTHGEITLQVYDITPDGFIHEYQRTIEAGAPISFDLPAQPHVTVGMLGSVGLGFLALCGAIALALSTVRTRLA